MAKSKLTAEERAELASELREVLPPGTRVYTILRHCSRSGMSRSIPPVVVYRQSGRAEPSILDLSGRVCRLLSIPFDESNGGCKVGGCGMDTGPHLVDHLSRALYPDGFGCIGDPAPYDWNSRCPSSDHSNGDCDYTPHSSEHPHWHHSGGYALRHYWL